VWKNSRLRYWQNLRKHHPVSRVLKMRPVQSEIRLPMDEKARLSLEKCQRYERSMNNLGLWGELLW